MRRCPRCGHPTRADRMIKGYGRECAAVLGLVGSTVDTGHTGPDLLDLLPTTAAETAEERDEKEPEDHCDGWDHP